jgi:DNA-binding Lrp family transcriptional regulator
MKHVVSKIERDEAVILDLVRRHGALSRVKIRAMTHLRPGTISMLVRKLLGEGKLLGVGLADNPRGRKQKLVKLNEDYGHIVAFEFDADQVDARIRR